MKENLKKSSTGAVEVFMTGEEMKAKKDGANETKAGNKKKKEVAAAKERDELLKKKLENAIATGKFVFVVRSNWLSLNWLIFTSGLHAHSPPVN